MFWGTDKGLTYFFPGQMSGSDLPLHPNISLLQAGIESYHFTEKDEIRFPYNASSFVFTDVFEFFIFRKSNSLVTPSIGNSLAG